MNMQASLNISTGSITYVVLVHFAIQCQDLGPKGP